MHDAITYAILFQAVAAVELFAIAAIQAFRGVPRVPRTQWIAEPLPVKQDFAERFDKAA